MRELFYLLESHLPSNSVNGSTRYGNLTGVYIHFVWYSNARFDPLYLLQGFAGNYLWEWHDMVDISEIDCQGRYIAGTR